MAPVTDGGSDIEGPQVAGEAKQVVAAVPFGACPGETQLTIETEDGNALLVTVPQEAQVGDMLVLSRAGDGWHMEVRGRKEVIMSIPPDAVPGETSLHIDIGGGEMVGLTVPIGALPGDKLVLNVTSFDNALGDGRPSIPAACPLVVHPSLGPPRLPGSEEGEAATSGVPSENAIQRIDVVGMSEALAKLEKALAEEREDRVRSVAEMEARFAALFEASTGVPQRNPQSLQLGDHPRDQNEQGKTGQTSTAVVCELLAGIESLKESVRDHADQHAEDIQRLTESVRDQVGHHAEDIQELRAGLADAVQRLERRVDEAELTTEGASVCGRPVEAGPPKTGKDLEVAVAKIEGITRSFLARLVERTADASPISKGGTPLHSFDSVASRLRLTHIGVPPYVAGQCKEPMSSVAMPTGKAKP